MRIEGQQAFVLRTQTYLESSLLVDIYARDYGRLKLIAKGAKSGRSKTANQLQLFSPLSLGWQGKSDLKTLTSVDGTAPLLNKSDKLVAGMYLNELLFFLMREADPHPELYDLYADTLSQLQSTELLEPSLRRFELGLLEELGYAIDFTCDTQGQELLPDHRYQYIPEFGFSAIDNAAGKGIPGEAILDLIENGLSTPMALKTAKLLCRSHIDLLLDGRELQSRKWQSANNK